MTTSRRTGKPKVTATAVIVTGSAVGATLGITTFFRIQDICPGCHTRHKNQRSNFSCKPLAALSEAAHAAARRSRGAARTPSQSVAAARTLADAAQHAALFNRALAEELRGVLPRLSPQGQMLPPGMLFHTLQRRGAAAGVKGDRTQPPPVGAPLGVFLQKINNTYIAAAPPPLPPP